MCETKTLDYYNKNASSFAEATVDVDFYDTQKHFQKLLPEQGYILDFGCGSGRDIKYFLSQHFQVDAIDGSEELCRIASDYTGIKVKKMLFKELEEIEKYDGIWACSSILHLPKRELKAVFEKMVKALKKMVSFIHPLSMAILKEREMGGILQILQKRSLMSLSRI